MKNSKNQDNNSKQSKQGSSDSDQSATKMAAQQGARLRRFSISQREQKHGRSAQRCEKERRRSFVRFESRQMR